ncbi:hypothetical protein [Inquilinus sp. CA228]|uniref:hypothetical protein n=1 Tax=Inquilinus sp. CA228 TaxID=3455609 RepID=UPI003F8D676D
MSEPKKVLLSYVADTETFVDAFCAPLFDDGGRLRRIEARIDDIPPGMDIIAEVSERVASADVIVSFICENYGRHPAAHDLRIAAQRRGRNCGGWPIVVPIILGLDGRSWWEKFQQEMPEAAALRNIADRPFFKPGTNSWVLPDPEDIHVIHDLRDWLCDLLAPPPPSLPSPSPQSLPAPLPDAVARIVLLGHPTRSLPEGVGKAAAQVAEALAAAGVPVQPWPDGWEGTGAPAGDAAAEKRTVFLQPLAAADAAASARTPSRTENYLVNALGEAARPRIEASPVVLWLPDGEPQEEFVRSAGQPGEANPVFRIDTAPALAEWLCHRFGFGRRGQIMACEEIEIRPVDARRQIVEELDEMIYGVPPPEDRLSVWFTASQFEHYFRSVADKRPILMAHDLKMPIPAMQGNANPVHQLIGKFRTLQAKADQILQELKLTSDDVFWIACITAEQTVVPPSVRLPNPSVDRWHMLRVERRNADFAVEQNSRKSVSEGLQSWMGH